MESVSPDDGYELFIVATRHYQAAESVEQYRNHAPEADFLLFTANWEGPGAIDELLSRSRYLWGSLRPAWMPSH